MAVSHDNSEQPLLASQQNNEYEHGKSPKAGTDGFRAWARLIGCSVSAASLGWHDGCIGPLIPYLQIFYGGISDQTVSLVFIGSFIGYTLASLLNVVLTSRLGLGRLIILGAAIQGVASAAIVLQPPFTVIIICYGIAGFGLALQDAQFNTYVARLPDAPTKLGIVHAIYGLSGMAAPIIATLLMQAGVPSPFFYFTNLAWSVLSVLSLTLGFSGNSSSTKNGSSGENKSAASLTTVVKSRAVWTSLIFIILYIGAEIGEAGWVASFLMRERDGGVASGYASAAFFGGLTASRIILLPLTAWLTEKRAVTLYAVIALAMQVVVWTSSSFVVDLIAIGAYGVVMGPMYPITLSLVTKATPHKYHAGAIGLMACLGQAGSAIFPFAVGSLAEIYGVKVLQPILVIILAIMVFVWQIVPSLQAQL